MWAGKVGFRTTRPTALYLPILLSKSELAQLTATWQQSCSQEITFICDSPRRQLLHVISTIQAGEWVHFSPMRLSLHCLISSNHIFMVSGAEGKLTLSEGAPCVLAQALATPRTLVLTRMRQSAPPQNPERVRAYKEAVVCLSVTRTAKQ